MAYCVEHFADNFHKYGEACLQKGFTKLDYPIWRNINACLKQKNITIYLTRSKIFNDLKLEIVKEHGEKIAEYTFPIKLYNFGDYLSEIYPESQIFYSRVNFAEIATDNLYAVKNNSDSCIKTINNNDKENNEMNTNKIFGNFDFGACDDNVKMSMYGLAVRGADGRYVAYDKATDSMVDAEVFNFNGSNFFYKMPVSVKDIVEGDVIIHMRKPMFVKGVEDFGLGVVDIFNAEEKFVKPVKNMFGFNFYTKVINFMDMMVPNATKATAENPFGNMWMFMLADGEMDMTTLAMMSMMNQNNGAAANPFLMAAMFGEKDAKKMLPFFAMMNYKN